MANSQKVGYPGFAAINDSAREVNGCKFHFHMMFGLRVKIFNEFQVNARVVLVHVQLGLVY